jgi:hypothetical protein
MSNYIDFDVIERGGEIHGGCDWRFAMAVMCIGCEEDLLHMFFLCVECSVTCSSGLGNKGLQHR